MSSQCVITASISRSKFILATLSKKINTRNKLIIANVLMSESVDGDFRGIELDCKSRLFDV